MFSNVTVSTLSEALLQLHGIRNDFCSRLFACLKVCLFGDFYSYHEGTENHSRRLEFYPASDVNVSVLSEWIGQRPDIRCVYKHGAPPGILHFGAPFSRGGAELHDELLRVLGQRQKLGLFTFDEHSWIHIVVSRSVQPFSENERQMLQMLRSHIAQACKSSNESSLLSEAIEVANVGFLVTDRRGTISYATVKARKLLRQYFCPRSPSTLPDRIQTWLSDGIKLGRVPLSDLTFDFGHVSLVVQMMSTANAPRYRLVLRETMQTLGPQPLAKLGLTKREAEVLFWASQGKSNGEIAIILASKVRTIAKHLERVFAKLMVENRTAAARAALTSVDRFSS